MKWLPKWLWGQFYCRWSLRYLFFHLGVLFSVGKVLSKFLCFKWVVNIRKLSSFEQNKVVTHLCWFPILFSVTLDFSLLPYFFSLPARILQSLLHWSNLWILRSLPSLLAPFHLRIKSLCLFCNVLDWLTRQTNETGESPSESSGYSSWCLFSDFDQSWCCVPANCCWYACIGTSTDACHSVNIQHAAFFCLSLCYAHVSLGSRVWIGSNIPICTTRSHLGFSQVSFCSCPLWLTSLA